MSGPALTDVPDRYDVVFQLADNSTYGFMYADSVESNLPFRTHKAVYSYSPTFLERQNVSNTYGDNFQDFFLTGAQDDFSLGEQQRYFRVNDVDRSRRYWAGQNLDPLTVPGQVSCVYNTTTVNVSGQLGGASVNAGCASVGTPGTFYMANATNLFTLNNAGTFTTVGAHLLGGAPNPWAMCSDGHNIYMSFGNAAKIQTVAEGASTFSTFSATAATSLVVNNNALYAYSAGSLLSLDTSGTTTAQFTWKDAKGAAMLSGAKLLAYGGSIFIIRMTGYTPAAEIWKFDGSGCSIQAQLPSDFVASDACVSAGIIFISGLSQTKPDSSSSGNTYRPVIYYYSNGSLGKLWESQTLTSSSSAAPALTTWGNGIIFSDYGRGSVMAYDLASGGVHSTFQSARAPGYMVTGGANNMLFFSPASTTADIYPISTHTFTSGLLQTSQYDFDNTLSKVFRGIKIDADIPVGTSIDIAYEIDGCGGTYTSLQTGATSGTEYALPATTTGHSISVQISLNSSTSATPVLKRVYVRAAPTLQQFRKREYLFDLSGGIREEVGQVSRRTRDNTAYPVDPKTACDNLVKVATQIIPFTVADRFTGSTGMNALPDLQQNQAGYDGMAIYEVEPNVFIGRINLREV